MTFQAWKASRIDAARAAIERIQLEVALEKIPSLERAPGEKQAVIRPNPEPATSVPRANGLNGGLGGRVLRPEQRLEQAKINFEIAKDLTISVYIAVYLSQYSTRASMLEIARKMTPEEVTELLLALRGQQEPEFNGSAISSAGSSSR